MYLVGCLHYTLVISDNFGCSRDTTTEYIITNLKSTLNPLIKSVIYPNPTSGKMDLIIEGCLKLTKIHMKIFNAIGIQAYFDNFNVTNSKFTKSLDLDLNPEVYYITFESEEVGKTMFKIIFIK